nr:hypothetical protein CFP56_19084 [Quercus suber]
MELPTLQKTQPLVEELTSLDDEVEAHSEEIEEETEEESTESLVCDENFEIFYHQDMTEDVAFTSIMVTIAVSEDREASEILVAMVIEKKLFKLLSLLKSHTGDATPEIPVVPKSLIPVPPPPTQTESVDKK